MPRRREHVPFNGDPPAVGSGDAVECRTAGGDWVRAVARGGPSYNDAQALGWLTYLTVPVDTGDGVRNWPAQDVRPIPARNETP